MEAIFNTNYKIHDINYQFRKSWQNQYYITKLVLKDLHYTLEVCKKVHPTRKPRIHSNHNYLQFCTSFAVKFAIFLESSLLFNSFYCLFF